LPCQANARRHRSALSSKPYCQKEPKSSKTREENEEKLNWIKNKKLAEA